MMMTGWRGVVAGFGLAVGFAGGITDLASQTQESFDGFHLGAALATQNVWGGSFVDGVDMLSQDRRTVVELQGGWRKQFGWFVAGASVQYGFLDGGLVLAEPERSLEVTYANDGQFGFGASAGVALESRWPIHAFAYAFETSRSFDVIVRQGDRLFRQNDEQGFLRYGVGVEAAISGRWHVRGTAGTYRVDFGDLVTNIDVSGELDVSLGVTLQLGG